MLKKRILPLLLAAVLCLGLLPAAAENDTRTLVEGVSPVEAITWVAALCINRGYEMDATSISTTDNTVSLWAGPFKITVETSGTTAVSVTLSAGTLDGKTANDMGYIFGQMLQLLSDIHDLSVFNGFDFGVLDNPRASSQSVIAGDYRIQLTIDPDDETPNQLMIALVSAPAGVEPENDLFAAQIILEAMGVSPIAQFSYDEETDPNHALGTEGKYFSKVTFALPSIRPDAVSGPKLEVEDGGSIEMFASPLDAFERQQTVMRNKLQYFNGREYDIVCGNALLRLSAELSPAEVGRVVAAFVAAVNGEPVPADADIGEPAEPVEAPTAIDDAAPDVDEAAAEVEAMANQAAAPAIAVGDIVTFGSYPADAAGNVAPLEWRVLEIADGQALLIATRAIDVYNVNWNSPTWDDSTLRAWLNGPFLEAAFSEAEAAALVLGDVSADPNPAYASSAGSDTRDRVFCPSVAEMNRLFDGNANRRREPTGYAVSRGVWVDANGSCYWWTRSPGPNGCGAACVTSDGDYDYDASYDGFGYGVCPMIRVDAAALR